MIHDTEEEEEEEEDWKTKNEPMQVPGEISARLKSAVEIAHDFPPNAIDISTLVLQANIGSRSAMTRGEGVDLTITVVAVVIARQRL